MYMIYGIPNCDSVKKAVTWFREQGIPYEFHDYKKSGITKAKLTAWSKQTGWEVLVNKKGTTWRALDPAVQAAVTSQASAVTLMSENTSVIKRPVIEKGDKVMAVGFNAPLYQQTFK